MSIYSSRFIFETDPSSKHFIFQLPDAWETRPFEYEWAKNFAEPSDIALDAACGLGHPLKFYLSDICKEVYACDIDKRILSPASIIHDIKTTFEDQIDEVLMERYFNDINFCHCTLTKMPYANQYFDKIYCISVLEHLNDTDMKSTFKEFWRVLKDDGMLILTFDYPTVNLDHLMQTLNDTLFEFYHDCSLEKPNNALKSTIWGDIYCFRALLQKKD